MKKRLSEVLAAALVSAVYCHAADLYRVSGVVVDAQTGAPRARARLAVSRTRSTVVEARQTTGTDGKFSFALPQGKYNLVSGVAGDRQTYGRKTPDGALGSSIIVVPGQDNSNLIFRWFPTGAISGRIVDEAGEPVENALVQLIGSRVTAGRRRMATLAWHRTDDRGEYRFGTLPGSVYYLAAAAQPWYAGPSAASDANQPSVAYATAYYPNSPQPGAAPLVLKPGEEARADLTLRAVPGARVIIELESPQAITGTVGLVVNGMGASDGYQRQERFNGSGQTLEGVPPGHYQVRLIGTSGELPVTGQCTIDVNGSDVEAKLSIKPNPSVSGTVQLKNPSAEPKGSVLVSLVLADTGGTVSTAVRPGGVFSFPSIAGGKYRIAIHGTDGYFASETYVQGAAYSKGVVDLLEGETVTIRMVASNETGDIGGFVMSGERTLEGAMVVLAPAAETDDWSAYRSFQTDSDGSYDFSNVPGGDYLLFAVEDTALEYTNPNTIRPYRGSAKQVRVAPHGSSSERIPLVKLPLGN
jgi:Carboxypeptidase regulatory-like domain